MTLENYLATPGPKYSVITEETWAADSVAQGIASQPRTFKLHGINYVILNVEPSSIQQLTSYMEAMGTGYEFEYVQGTGKAKLLTHAQALELLAQEEVTPE